jgi:hypothetical protein
MVEGLNVAKPPTILTEVQHGIRQLVWFGWFIPVAPTWSTGHP